MGLAYTIDGNELSTFKMLAGRAPGSNLAVSGFLDFPKRMHKAFHQWPDQDGVEPWLNAGLIHYEGRDIDFYGLIKATDLADAKNQLGSFFAVFSSATDLITLDTTESAHDVYQRDEITANYMGDGWVTVHLPLREPVPDLTGDIPVEADANNFLGIDRKSWDTLGLIPLELLNRYHRAQLQNMSFSVYGKEGYEITKREANTRTFKGVLNYASLTELVSGCKGLYAILQQAKLLRLKLPSDDSREFFNTEGFSVTNIKVAEGQVTALFEMTIIEDDIVTDVIVDSGIFDNTFDATFG